MAQWKETLKEVERVGQAFWEVREFQRLPGVGPIAAHVFSAIIETPERFQTKAQLRKYCSLSITDPGSEVMGSRCILTVEPAGKSGAEKLVVSRSVRPANRPRAPMQSRVFIVASKERTHDVRHARLNTQRKILENALVDLAAPAVPAGIRTSFSQQPTLRQKKPDPGRVPNSTGETNLCELLKGPGRYWGKIRSTSGQMRLVEPNFKAWFSNPFRVTEGSGHTFPPLFS